MEQFFIEILEYPLDESFIDEFVSFPEKVRSNEYKTGLTPAVQIRKLVQWGLRNSSSFWLIKNKETGKTLIRLSARPCPHIDGQGTIGFFEIDLEAAEARKAFEFAIEKVSAWLKDQGVQKIIAPVDINTWFNYRFSVMGQKFFPRYSWEPTTPPEYIEIFRQAGFQDFAKYHSVFFPHFRLRNYCIGTGYMKKCYHRIEKLGFHLRPFDQERFMTHEVPILHELSHESFKESLLFEPIDLETFANLYAAAKNYDSSPSSVLISPEGEVAGFIFAFYDGDFLVIKSLAIKKKYQGLKLSSGLIYNAVKQSFKKKKKGTISALVRTGIASEKIEKNSNKTKWFVWTHDYLLMQKELKQ
jgi:hypothetical protein